ncbi:antioxidant AhpC/TSA family [Parabacteroides sp. CAG:409]|nr:antioxidant AhpC/TSA family [Parabacteroides sp. CAG:409]
MNGRRKMQKAVCAFLLGTTLFSCSDQKEIQITGTVRNLNGGMIVYQQSIAGMMNSKTVDTLQIQSDSTFTLTLPAEDYERVNFIWYGKAVLGSVISKGGKIQLDVDATAQEPLTIQGMDEKEVAVSRLLNQLDADVWDLRARRGDRWQIAKDTVATSVAQKLKDDAVSMESQLAGLDKDLQEKVRQDIRMQLLLAFQNQTMGAFYRTSEATRQDWFTELEQMTAFCVLDNPNSTFSPAFYDVVSNEIGIRCCSLTGFCLCFGTIRKGFASGKGVSAL